MKDIELITERILVRIVVADLASSEDIKLAEKYRTTNLLMHDIPFGIWDGSWRRMGETNWYTEEVAEWKCKERNL